MPNLVIILVSVASGLGTGVLGFYLFYAVATIDLFWSTGLAALALIAGVSAPAAFLSALHDRRTISINIGFSCGLMALLLAFSGFCLILGILAGVLALIFQ